MITQSLYHGMHILVIIATGTFFYEGNYELGAGAILILLSLALFSFLGRNNHAYISFSIRFSITAFVFLTLYLGHAQRFYSNVPYWDTLLHFLSGILLGAIGYVLVLNFSRNENAHTHFHPAFISLFVFAFSVSVGALWEIGEFLAGPLFDHRWTMILSDTMLDLLADTLGAILVGALGYLRARKRTRLPFAP